MESANHCDQIYWESKIVEVFQYYYRSCQLAENREIKDLVSKENLTSSVFDRLRRLGKACATSVKRKSQPKLLH